jgi:hypothetical protein
MQSVHVETNFTAVLEITRFLSSSQFNKLLVTFFKVTFAKSTVAVQEHIGLLSQVRYLTGSRQHYYCSSIQFQTRKWQTVVDTELQARLHTILHLRLYHK